MCGDGHRQRRPNFLRRVPPRPQVVSALIHQRAAPRGLGEVRNSSVANNKAHGVERCDNFEGAHPIAPVCVREG